MTNAQTVVAGLTGPEQALYNTFVQANKDVTTAQDHVRTTTNALNEAMALIQSDAAAQQLVTDMIAAAQALASATQAKTDADAEKAAADLVSTDANTKLAGNPGDAALQAQADAATQALTDATDKVNAATQALTDAQTEFNRVQALLNGNALAKAAYDAQVTADTAQAELNEALVARTEAQEAMLANVNIATALN